ncbi:uncharacterized protein PV09_05718 [Verruconis gallopava]|uniref:RRM domain-containing protein n=1 Tax=Verruconis gallopava TaxID=253628 RepID=A0A0D1YR77_9PEZI|nr:uncharacterized protein PV09_05718 [Verruconis gallopava]KIW03072.1 hypothetical protein PV09_05718 [Verruconis gallopava]
MSEFENNDDDIFADIYDDDEPAPQPPAEQPAVNDAGPPQTVAQPADSNSQSIPQPSNEAQMNNDASTQNNGSNSSDGDNNGAGSNGVGHEEDAHEPIGMKEDGKMFIGGLNWETTDQSLKDYFSQFGEVVECTVMRDGATGRSRGFGFLTFKDPKTVNIVMVKEHHLDGKIIDPKRAIPREEQERTAKIFVGGVSQECTEQQFKEFFMKFGRVIDATLMMDKDTGRPRGFGFVTFDGEDAVDRTLQQPLAIHGKPIEVKRAEPRGNVHDDKSGAGGKFGKRGGRAGNDQGGQFDGNGQDQFQQGQGQAQNTNGMSQAQMAAYWFKMQEYFRNMQTMMARNMAAQSQMPNMMGGMNPAMMQMMMAQRQGMMSPGGTAQMANGGPAMSAGMQNQMMQQAAPGNQGGQGFNSQEQMDFERQKYEKQQMARMQQSQYQSQQGGYGPTSWEGMYDDVPQPNMIPTGPSGSNHAGRAGFGGGRGRRGGQKHDVGAGHPGGNPPPNAPTAPANAPTGPRNAGRPGANYRGGGRGGHMRGFRPY